MRDLLSDFNNYALPTKWRYASETVNDVNAPLAWAHLSKLWILCHSDIFDGDLCKHIFITIFFLLFFLFLNIILSTFYALILPVSQLQTEQVMTPQIGHT